MVSAAGVAHCPNARWMRGECDGHGNERWVLVPCGRRSCERCGPLGRWWIASKIAWGIRECERQGGRAAWIVLTWPWDVDKGTAVRQVNRFMAKLRRRLGRLEVAKTWEVTKRQRLHCNLIVLDWGWIGQRELQRLWGARLWVAWVRDDGAVGRETAKAYSPESLGNYVSKLEQSVQDKRRVSFSKGWPRLPQGGIEREGAITWRVPGQDEVAIWIVERDKGWWAEVRPGEWASALGEGCTCFDLRAPP